MRYSALAHNTQNDSTSTYGFPLVLDRPVIVVQENTALPVVKGLCHYHIAGLGSVLATPNDNLKNPTYLESLPVPLDR